MAKVDRWKAAQEYERGYWASVATKIASGAAPQMDWYRWRADRLMERLANLDLDAAGASTARVLEVGSGPIGVASFFPANERIAVDPLHPFYAGDSALSALRDPAVQYREGVGEQIPCESASCDLVIIENCIDHVQDVDVVMGEISRVLKPGGSLYLTVNCRTFLGYFVHRALSRLRIDRGHPHTFTPGRAVDMLRRHGFEVLAQEQGSAGAAHLEDLRGPSLRKRLKAVMGVSEYLVSLVGLKRS